MYLYDDDPNEICMLCHVPDLCTYIPPFFFCRTQPKKAQTGRKQPILAVKSWCTDHNTVTDRQAAHKLLTFSEQERFGRECLHLTCELKQRNRLFKHSLSHEHLMCKKDKPLAMNKQQANVSAQTTEKLCTFALSLLQTVGFACYLQVLR